MRVGDKLICIRSISDKFLEFKHPNWMTKGIKNQNTFEVIFINKNSVKISYGKGEYQYSIFSLTKNKGVYLYDYFISEKQNRKNKLEKIIRLYDNF